MSQRTRAQLEALKTQYITSGGRQITGAKLRAFQTEIIDSCFNLLDDIGGGVYSASNGISLSGNDFQLGGALGANTSITGSYSLNLANDFVGINTATQVGAERLRVNGASLFETSIRAAYATVSTVPYFNASRDLISSAVTPTELGYLSGVTSAIQTQINNINAGLSWKAACRVATTGNITLSGTQTIDGVAVVVGDRVLVKNQSPAGAFGMNNGIYVVAAGAWARSADAAIGGSTAGATSILYATVVISEGATYADQIWTCSTDAPITIGVTAIDFVKTSATTYVGTANQIDLTGNAFSISASYLGQSSITTLGTITTGVWNGTAIANANLANSSTTINGTAISLGASGTITADAGTLTGTTLNATVVTSSLTSVGTLTGGTWNASVIGAAYGGTGIANNAASTITISGNFATTFVTTSASSYTLPTASATLLANNLGLSGGSTLIGGTAVGDVLNLKGTSGNGTSGVAAINFLVGNNGATVAANIYNSGNIHALLKLKIGGTSTFASYALDVQGTNTNITGSLYYGAGDARIRGLSATGTAYGVSLFGYNGATEFNALNIVTSNTSFTTSGGAITNFTFNCGAHTAQTASTAIPHYLINLPTTQWATGALAATQPFVSITQPTISFVGSSTATLTATMRIAGAPNSGTNAIQTAACGLLVESAAVNGTGTVGTSYGAYFNAQTGASTNYALGLNGNFIVTGTGNISSTLTLGSAVLTGGITGTVAAVTDVYFTTEHFHGLSTVGTTTLFFDRYPSSSGVGGASGTVGVNVIPFNATLIGYSVSIAVLGTLGTANNATISARINNTTDVTLTAVGLYSAAKSTYYASNLNTNVTAGDYVEIKVVPNCTPTAATNVTCAVTLYWKRQ